MPPRRNVLIFHAGALGDFVLTWPLALALARLYPQSRVYYVTSSGKGKLAERTLRIDSTDLDTAGWHNLFAAGPLPPAALKLVTEAHTIISFLTDGVDAWSARARQIAGAEAALIPLIPPTRAVLPQPGFEREHAADFIVRQLAPWPALAEATRQILRSINERGIATRPPPTGGTIIHPGSGGRDKCWPLDRYVTLATRLIAAGRRVTFTIGEVELDRWSPQDLSALETITSVKHCTTLLDLFSVLQSAEQFIGNDSGPAHLAGILAVPTLALFGPTDPANWKPLGPNVRILRATPLDNLSAEEVLSTSLTE